MSRNRRYDDAEIREILELVYRESEPDVPALSTTDGLTLSELEDVGREVGIAPEQLARAVAEYEGRGRVAQRETRFGMPRSVGRTAPLLRAPTEEEWEILVSELRTTFGGKGEVTSHGNLREWSSGYLHAFIEPTEDGYRLRLTDVTEGGTVAVFLGGIFLAFALMLVLILLGKDADAFKFVIPGFFAVIGGGLVGGTVLALPRWANERERQMEHITSKASLLIGPPREQDG
jgi:hypothetical protein